MDEIGLATVSVGVAAFRVAKHLAQEILERGEDPLKHVRDFERLWINAEYPREIQSIGNLDDELYIANLSEDQSRAFVVKRLKEFIQIEEPK